jgi:GDP/UDP-N,N'-diacetylbacillosamine 2-epimerase (hydrolysing)
MRHEIEQLPVSALPSLPALLPLPPGEGWGEGELRTSRRLKDSSLHFSPQSSPGGRGGRKSRSLTKNICFVTGTRAEFGLMKPVLRAIETESHLRLQLIATGMHLDPAHGDGVAAIQSAGFTINQIVPWDAGSGRNRATSARNTGRAMASLAETFDELKTDVVLVVGDRVEAFAAAAAAHLSGIVVAHVHGGDRAAGQVDDALRHAISKLAHVHLPATRESADRLHKLGEDSWRIHRVGSPGIDGITDEAASPAEVMKFVGSVTKRRYALLVLHPVDADEAVEGRRAATLLRAASSIPYEQIVVVYPNNDPGAGGIIKQWDALNDPRYVVHRDLPRSIYLGLLRDAAVLMGNSSSGIIEAASFGIPVLDIGPRQAGRERGGNVTNVSYAGPAIARELKRLWNNGRPKRFKSDNIYGGNQTGRRIARILSKLTVDDRLLGKLIRY